MKALLTEKVRATVIEALAGSKKHLTGRTGSLQEGTQIHIPSVGGSESTGLHFVCMMTGGLRVEGVVFPNQYKII